ncbi:MAG TPA: GNAT family N-acetyltransferase, partial [Acidimicrobiales bacterium]|nr:GNAT family N-acetyltransferase [Acidimicrobiales bacterium]
MEYRAATPGDVEAIARLHTASWQDRYGGIFSDEYLDHQASEERLAVWEERFRVPDPSRATVVALEGGELVGFAHWVYDADPKWGTLLDNIHVARHLQGRGVGRSLMSEVASGVAGRPTRTTGLYLWVYELNPASQAFYRALGGQ